MSEINFKCSNCDADIAIDDSAGGQTAICPSCSNTIMIPMPGIKEGLQLGDFLVQKRLGVGGMGEVWLAKQTGMNRDVALKILAPALSNDKSFIDRFMTEVNLSAKLEHQNIVSAYAAGEDKGIRYLAMSFVDGCELEDRLKIDKIMPEKQALEIIKSLAGALKYAWNKFQIIHRDIKPANIMLDEDNEPKLMDMGISKSLSENTQLTMTGVIIGSPHYMSPEQGRAEEDLDFRADLYSLGATLYQMVAGTVPYDATTAMGILSRHLTDPFPCPFEHNPNLSEECAVLLEIMMAKSPDNRQDSWEDLITDIDLVIQGKFPRTSRPAVGKSLVMQETRSQAFSRRKVTNPSQQAHTMKMDTNANLQSSGQKKSPIALIMGVVALLIVLIIVGVIYNNKVTSDKKEKEVKLAQIAKEEKLALQKKVEKEEALELKRLSQELANDKKEKDLAKQTKIKEAYDFAANYAKENPKEYVMIINNFKKVKALGVDTIISMKIDSEIAKVNKLLDAAKLAQIAEQKRKKEEQLAQVAKEKAEAEAKKLADEKLAQIANEEDKQFAQIAKNILKGDFSISNEKTKDILADLASPEKAILNGAKNAIGEKFVFNIKNTETECVIDKIKNNKIYIKIEYKGAKITKTIKISDLTMKDKGTLFAGQSPESKAIYKGLGFVKVKNLDSAEKEFANAGKLSKYLIAVITGKAAQLAEQRKKAETARIALIAEKKAIAEEKRLSKEEAKGSSISKGDNFTIPKINLDMIFVEKGKFTMGEKDNPKDNLYRHSVILTKPYWIGKYEVTQEQYQNIMNKNPSKFQGKNNPVEQVSWFDAQKFCEKLTEKEKKAGRLPNGYVYRLPTEAEWELAARGGVKNKKQTLFSGSEAIEEVAWFMVNSGDKTIKDKDYNARNNNNNKTHKVGQKKPNALGIYDMSGNVWEWCLDMSMIPKDAKKANTTITKTYVNGIKDPLSLEGANRILRGGSWNNVSNCCRVAYRHSIYGPSGSKFIIGFRLSLAPVR